MNNFGLDCRSTNAKDILAFYHAICKLKESISCHKGINRGFSSALCFREMRLCGSILCAAADRASALQSGSLHQALRSVFTVTVAGVITCDCSPDLESFALTLSPPLVSLFYSYRAETCWGIK